MKYLPIHLTLNTYLITNRKTCLFYIYMYQKRLGFMTHYRLIGFPLKSQNHTHTKSQNKLNRV